MHVLQRIRCAFGSHKRDGRRVWREESAFHSRCSGCGKPMHRTIDGWELEADGPTRV